jgi:predicted unusual protein kinase regulating ubiquinone biosynthesis (AarF/ABC1/UbiB family)
MYRPDRCEHCRIVLPRGTDACLRIRRGRVRGILCLACGETADAHPGVSEIGPAEEDSSKARRPVSTAALIATSACAARGVPAPPHGSTAVWIAVGILGLGALLASRTGRRVLTTAGVAAKTAAKGAAGLARGETNQGPALLRSAFEDLGPTYVKLGQLVASSQGLFPEPYCQEFRKCLDRVRPFSFDEVRRSIQAELGRDPEEVFSFLDPEPLASASIAQVHAARLRDGQEVVVKVQRPRIESIVMADLRVLRWGARAMTLLPHGELANPVGVVEDFEANLREELDFRAEARSMAEFNRIMAIEGQARVAAPRVIDGLSTRRVLVMERFFGHRVDDVEGIRASKVETEERLLLGMQAWLKCMMLHGFFHGDVHAGNLMTLDDGRVGFLDFGIVGRFTPERRVQVTDYLIAFATGDFTRLSQVLVDMGSIERGKVDIGRLATDLAAAYEPILTDQVSPAKYADILPTILRTGVKHGMRMPRDFVLVVKQMLYFDRYAKRLAPELNVFRDPRIVSALMEDATRAQASRESATGAREAGNTPRVDAAGSYRRRKACSERAATRRSPQHAARPR